MTDKAHFELGKRRSYVAVERNRNRAVLFESLDLRNFNRIFELKLVRSDIVEVYGYDSFRLGSRSRSDKVFYSVNIELVLHAVDVGVHKLALARLIRGVENRNIRTFLFTFETFEIVVSGAGNVDCRHTVAFLVERRIAVDCVVHRCDVQMLVTDVDLATIGAVVVCERHDVFRHALFIETAVFFVVLCDNYDFDAVFDFVKSFGVVHARVVEHDKSVCDCVAVRRVKSVFVCCGFEKNGVYDVGVDINLVNLFLNEVCFVESVKLRPRTSDCIACGNRSVVDCFERRKHFRREVEVCVVDKVSACVGKSVVRNHRCADKFVALNADLCTNKAFNRACTLKRIVVDIFDVDVEFDRLDGVCVLIERFFADRGYV